MILTADDCIDYTTDTYGPDACNGSVEYRHSLTGTGVPIPRCDKHWAARLDKQDEINRRYAPHSDVPPSDFDPYYAGERWDDDY